MTHITVQVPVIRPAPRGAEPLALAAFALAGIVRRGVDAMLLGLRSRHLLGQAVIHAPRAEATCKDGIGSIKG